MQEHTCAARVRNERRGERGWGGEYGDGRVVREMRGCRGEGVAGKGKINRGRGRGIAVEVLELLVWARRREGEN